MLELYAPTALNCILQLFVVIHDIPLVDDNYIPLEFNMYVLYELLKLIVGDSIVSLLAHLTVNVFAVIVRVSLFNFIYG
jgi:hypothetical protein